MKTNATHRIRTSRVVVTGLAAPDAFAVRGKLRGDWGAALLPAIERAFDAAGSGDRIVRIPSIELDVRVRSIADLDDLPELIHAALVERLGAVMTPRDAGPRGEDVAGERARGGDHPNERAAGWNLPIERMRRADRRDALVHYLHTGSLPWADAGASDEATPDELRDACDGETSALVAQAEAAVDLPAFLVRLFQLLPEHGARAFVERVIGDRPADWSGDLARVIAAVLASPLLVLSRHRRLALAAGLGVLAMRDVQGAEQPDVHGVAARILSAAERAAFDSFLASMRPRLRALDRDRAANGERRLAPKDHVETGAAAAAGAGPAIERGDEPAMTESGSVVRADRQRSVDEDPAKSGAMQRVSERAAGPGPRVVPVDAPPDRAGAGVREIETGANAPAMIRNAGLVILHPFIASIFNATGIAEGGRLGDDGGTIARAAAILHYLATGREEAYEFELGMARLLLGAEPDVPMHVAAGALHPGDAEEADALLASAIGHWKLLGNTSADALRGSFLARPGLLRRDDAGWRLHIEPAPFDMLLGGLPWSIAIVKLPWMRRPIHTEWMAP